MTYPVIGLTMDSQEAGGYAQYPWYALRQNYCALLSDAGGTPICLPHHQELVGEYARLIHGLVVTGGDFDVSPKHYNADYVHPTVKINEARTSFELYLVSEVQKLGKPVFGICGGAQILNVARGGTLIQDIPSEVPESSICHSQTYDRHCPAHAVGVVEGTRLYELTGKKHHFLVNSVHHQAVKDLGKGLVVNCRSTDGLIEGIEDPSLPFYIGVQWHPEFLTADHDIYLYTRFVEHCRAVARR